MKNDQKVHKHIAVIADDLTGANDTGVQFAKQGLKTIVLLDSDSPPGPIEETVVVVDSQSRALTAEEAYLKVSRAARLFKDHRFPVVFKKIDSTLRGNLGREIDAIMDTCGQEVAVVAPAFPKNGRTTVGGIHLLQGTPLEATEIARDPQCPVTESHIPTLLSAQTIRKVGHVGIKGVLAGLGGMLKAMEKMIARGKGLMVCDTWEDKHLEMLIEAALGLKKPVLWVGSAGLAEYLPSALGLVGAPGGKEETENSPVAGGPVVILVGSVSTISRAQVRRLKKRPDLEYVEVDPCALLQPDTASREIRRCLDLSLEAVRAGKDVVITSGYSDEVVDRTRQKALSLSLSFQETAEKISGALGLLGQQMAKEVKLGGLVLTGGDIALSSCRLLSATGIKVLEEVAPGIPLGRLKGGLCDGLKVITKAGAFGAEDALCQAVDYLKSESKTKESGNESFQNP